MFTHYLWECVFLAFQCLIRTGFWSCTDFKKFHGFYSCFWTSFASPVFSWICKKIAACMMMFNYTLLPFLANMLFLHYAPGYLGFLSICPLRGESIAWASTPRCTGKLGRLKISMAMKLAETLGSAYRENLQYPNHTANVHIPLGFLCDFMVTNSLNNTSECQQCKKINTTHDQGKPKHRIILVHNKQLPWVTNNSEIGNPI